MITRRDAARLVAAGAAAAVLAPSGPALAQGAAKTVKVGIDLSLTGADADSAERILHGAQMAFDQANAKHEIPGYQIQVLTYDDGTATAGQYDPAQAATNARKMVGEGVVAAVGPMMSGAGKAMAPILSQGDLATITPASTNPDITNPKFAAQYKPEGKAIYFRTVTTDAYQGPELANYFAEKLGVKTVYILDDSGAYGVGVADEFEKEAKKKGIKVLGRDRLDPKAADYSAVLTKIKSMHPDALYYGGVAQAGVKLAKQAYDIIPNVIKGGGDGVYSVEMLKGVGYPANQGWYATIASPHTTEDADAAAWVKAYSDKYHTQPDDYAITAYDAALVIVDSIKRVVAAGKPVNKSTVRDAIQDAHVKTLQGTVSFDQNGDLKDRTISIFQIKQDKNFPADDILHQYRYVGVAPQA
ncbi:MAG TPA: branched-chain amino acid ABC transporter substrate-binding protein [Acetobacteraceae bacterium]|nr:branched-chain amino acid ABC transporter substrate-binding protein [Acetobacteraceae bacterium]